MKTLQILVIILIISIINTCYAQTPKDTIKTNTLKVKKENFMDMGAETLTQIFGENLDGKQTGKKLSFLELLNKMDMPIEQKEEYRNWYYLQSKDLTEKQKDSLSKALEKKILEAEKNQL